MVQGGCGGVLKNSKTWGKKGKGGGKTISESDLMGTSHEEYGRRPMEGLDQFAKR